VIDLFELHVRPREELAIKPFFVRRRLKKGN
jgi:hypothetical protein